MRTTLDNLKDPKELLHYKLIFNPFTSCISNYITRPSMEQLEFLFISMYPCSQRCALYKRCFINIQWLITHWASPWNIPYIPPWRKGRALDQHDWHEWSVPINLMHAHGLPCHIFSSPHIIQNPLPFIKCYKKGFGSNSYKVESFLQSLLFKIRKQKSFESNLYF